MSFDPGREVQKVEQDAPPIAVDVTTNPVTIQEAAPVEVTATVPLDVNLTAPSPLPVSLPASPLPVVLDASQQPLLVQTQNPVTVDGTVTAVLPNPLPVVIDASQPLPLPVAQQGVVTVTDDGSPILVDIAGQALSPLVVTDDGVPIKVEIVQPAPTVQVEPVTIVDATFAGAQLAGGAGYSSTDESDPHIQLFNPIGSGVNILVGVVNLDLYTAGGGGGDYVVELYLTQTQQANVDASSKAWKDTRITAPPAPRGVINGGVEAVVGGVLVSHNILSVASDNKASNVTGAGGSGLLAILSPGWGLSVKCTGDVVQMSVNFSWDEQAE